MAEEAAQDAIRLISDFVRSVSAARPYVDLRDDHETSLTPDASPRAPPKHPRGATEGGAAVYAPREPLMRALIVRRPRSRRVADRIAYAKLVAESLKDNPYFPDPIPALARLVVHIAAADAAQVAASTREAGTAATLAAAVRAVEGDLESLHVHVQSVARLDATNGPAIVASAGMSLKDARGPSKADFAVKQGRISGSVVLSAGAVARKASYDWQYSTDEETWTSGETTFKAKTTLLGLAAGTRYFFRFRARTPKGLRDWSRVLFLIVV